MTCEVAAERISNRLDSELPFGPRIALAVHRALCGKCRRYGRLLAELEHAGQDFFAESAVAPASLSAAAAERIKAALRESAEE